MEEKKESVTDAEIKNIEEKIVKQENEKMATIMAKAKEEARKELLKEQEFKNLQSEKAKLEATIAKQANEREELKKQFDKEKEDLKSQIGSTKAIINNDNPFGNQKKAKTDIFDVSKLSVDELMEIDEKSREAFFGE